MSYLRRISARLGQLGLAVPAQVREDAKLALLHNLIAALAARDLRVPGDFHSHESKNTAGPGSARLLRDSSWAPTHRAVVSNSLLMGARAQHDEHPGSVAHFGTVVIPALLALADTGELSGDKDHTGTLLLNAMAIGYQAGAALARATSPRRTPRGFRPTGIFGPFGGAAACAIARGMDEMGRASALAFALSSASSITQVWRDGSDEWRFQTAFAARAGFESAELTQLGAQGATHALEGDSGFLRAFGGFEGAEANQVAEQVLNSLDGRWAISELLLKPYPVCAINQAALWQALQLIDTHRIDPDAVESVEVSLSPSDAAYPGIDHAGAPDSWAQAMMSLPHAIATALIEQTVTFDHLTPPYPAAVSSLASRVSVLADGQIEGDHAAIVRFRMRGGEVLGNHSPTRVPRGWPSTIELCDRLAPEHSLSKASVESLISAVQHIDAPNGLVNLQRTLREQVISSRATSSDFGD